LDEIIWTNGTERNGTERNGTSVLTRTVRPSIHATSANKTLNFRYFDSNHWF